MLWTLSIVAAALSAVVLFLAWFARRSDNWGATAGEIAAALPGDGWIEDGPPVRVRMTRATWVEVPVESVWPFVAQMGRGAGWYSYDRLDNGGRSSARHVVSWIPAPRLGDASVVGYLRHLEPGRELAWWIGGTRFLGCRFRGVMFYRVTGEGDRCRLLVRVQSDIGGPLARPAGWLFRSIDGFMARRQLIGIRLRAEGLGVTSGEHVRSETGARDQYQLYQTIFASGGEAGVSGRSDAVEWRRRAVEDGAVEPTPNGSPS